MTATWTAVPTNGGTVDVFLARASAPAKAGIVMLHEIFGVNDAMRREAEELAAAGFDVAVPDLFHRQQRRADLSYGEEDRRKGFTLMQGLDVPAALEDIDATMQWLRRTSNARPVGLMGFCLGGKLAVLAGARGGADAVVSLYGVQLDRHLTELTSIEVPLQIHVGDADEHIPAEAVTRIRDALAGRENARVFVYPGAGHGFANASRADVFHAEAARVARQRALSIFE